MWVLAVVCVILVWLVSGLLLRALSSGEVLSGTSMEGVELGGKTRIEAANLIDEFEPRATKLLGADQSITVRAPQAGLMVDTQASTRRAYDAGRTGLGSFLAGPLFTLTSREVDPVYAPVNNKQLAQTMKRIAGQVDREPFVGALDIDPETLDVSAKQPEAGVLLKRAEAREELLEALRAGDESMEIPLRRQPAPSLAEVESVAAEAESYLQEPLQINTAGGPAEFTPSQMASILAIESTKDGIRLGADRKALKSLVAAFAAKRDLKARDAKLDTPAVPPASLSDKGDVSWRPIPNAATAIPGKVGRQIQQKKAVASVIGAIHQNSHQARFPAEIVKPEVTTSEMSKATWLVGTFTTEFSCCEPRVTNIQQMASTVDGTVIPPGGQFSLNTVAGERTRANGYKPAPTIGENNELINTIGGGVSQFSTTLYNAAYFAGLQIDSHTPHSFYIDRYPAGRESTLNYGSIDLLWTNDTDAPVVVRSSAGDTSVTVSLYGNNGGRRVRAVTTSRTNNSRGGFDITVERVVTNPDGKRNRDSFTTNYGLPAE